MASAKEQRLARRMEQRLVQQTMQAFSGPLPPPQMLAQYNDIVPNGAERIVAMAEKQQAHRQDIEATAVKKNLFDQRLGLVLGFILMMSVAGSGIWCVAHGKDIAGLTALLTSVGAPVTAFVYGRKKQSDERQNKS